MRDASTSGRVGPGCKTIKGPVRGPCSQPWGLGFLGVSLERDELRKEARAWGMSGASGAPPWKTDVLVSGTERETERGREGEGERGEREIEHNGTEGQAWTLFFHAEDNRNCVCVCACMRACVRACVCVQSRWRAVTCQACAIEGCVFITTELWLVTPHSSLTSTGNLKPAATL